MPAKFEDDLIWVAADTPLSDSAFLSNKIKDLCGDLPIFWLRPTYSTSKNKVQSQVLNTAEDKNKLKRLSNVLGGGNSSQHFLLCIM